jgi:prophage regulatory protein
MNTMSHENHYLSVDQVAARFDVSKDTIWRWKREGDFPPPVKLGGNTSRWRLSHIEEWEGQRPCCMITHLDIDVRFMKRR